MPSSRYPVKNNANHVGFAIEDPVTKYHGGGAACHGRGVHHQNHGQSEQLCHLRRATLFRGAAPAVIESHHSFHHGNVFVAQVLSKGLAVVVLRQHPAVESIGRHAANFIVQGGVDEIRPDFEWLNFHAAPSQRRHDAERDRGFSDTAVSAGHDECGQSSKWLAV